MPRPVSQPTASSQRGPQTCQRANLQYQQDSPATTNLLSPPCNSTLLQDLNSGGLDSPNSSCPPLPDTTSPENQDDVEEEFVAGDDGDNESLSSDETWTPSVEGEDFDEDYDLDDDGSIWQETPIQYKDFSISFNKADCDLEFGYRRSERVEEAAST